MVRTVIRPAVVLFLSMTILTGLIYPLVVTGIAKAVFPAQASGSLIEQDGKAIGSSLIGQNFSDAKYFWSRPSATAPQPYNGVASAGSNLGPLNPALIENVKLRIDALHAVDPDNKLPIPVDLVTASGSGLDPEESIAAAAYQVDRVAKARGFSAESVQTLLQQHAKQRWLGFFGEPRINVLELNLALDNLAKK